MANRRPKLLGVDESTAHAAGHRWHKSLVQGRDGPPTKYGTTALVDGASMGLRPVDCSVDWAVFLAVLSKSWALHLGPLVDPMWGRARTLNP